MKKMLSIYLICMILCGAFGFYAEAAETSPVFDLDISGYGTTGVVDKAGNATLQTYYMSGITGLGNIKTLYGETPYLHLKDATSSAGLTGFNATGDFYRNKSEMSIELWFRPQPSSGRLLAMYAQNASNNEVSSCDVFLYKEGSAYRLFYRPGRTTNDTAYYNANGYADITSCLNQWTHVVFTRKWTNFNETTRIGTCTYETYINGVKSTDTDLCNSAEMYWRNEKDYMLALAHAVTDASSVSGDLGGVKVYNRILSTSEVASHYSSEMANYIEATQSMKIDSVTPSSSSIATTAGEMIVNFNNYIDPETAEGNIYLAYADGTEIKGKSYPVLDSSFTKSVRLKYGKLDSNTEYVLHVTSGVQSLNHFSPEDYQKTFTTGNNMLINENFMGADYVVGQPAPTNKGIQYTSSVSGSGEVVNNSSNIIVQGDDSFRYISMGGGGNLAINNRIRVLFDQPISNNVLIAEVKARPATKEGGPNTAPRDFISMLNQNSSEIKIGSMRSDNVIRGYGAITNVTSVEGSIIFSADSKDKNGFFNTRTVFKKDASGNYYATLTNKNKASDGTFMVKPLTALTSIKGLQIAHIYPYNSMAEAIYDLAEISEIKIWVETTPNVLYTNLKKLTQTDDTIAIVFDDDMDETKFVSGAVGIVTADNKTVKTEIEGYDTNRRTIYLKLHEHLDYGAGYKLKFNGLQNINNVPMEVKEIPFQTDAYEIVQTDVTFTNQSGTAISSLAGATGVSANISLKNNAELDKTCMVILVVSNENNRIVRVESRQETISAKQSGTIRVDLNDQTFLSEYAVTAYVWDLKSADFLPIAFEPAIIRY